jgi:hypothetical protein
MAQRANPGGKKMKKLSLISLAVAAALAICPAALVGQTLDWSVDANGITGSGTVSVVPNGVPGVYNITNMGGTFADTNLGEVFSGTVIGIDPSYLGETYPPSYSLSSPSPDTAGDLYDELLYLNGSGSPSSNINGVPGNGGGQEDAAGFIFNVQTTSGVYEVQIYQNGSTPYDFTVNPDGSYQGPPYGTPTNFSVPEGGAALLYMLLAGGACFGVMFFSRNRFANLVSA